MIVGVLQEDVLTILFLNVINGKQDVKNVHIHQMSILKVILIQLFYNGK